LDRETAGRLCYAREREGGARTNVTLTPEQEAMVREKVASGRFGGPAEVVDEALRLLDEQERLEHLRSLMDEGIAQLDRGEKVLYTPELREQIWQNALDMVARGEKPDDDVVP